MVLPKSETADTEATQHQIQSRTPELQDSIALEKKPESGGEQKREGTRSSGSAPQSPPHVHVPPIHPSIVKTQRDNRQRVVDTTDAVQYRCRKLEEVVMEGRVKGEVGFLCVGLSDSGEVDIDGFLNLEEDLEEDEKGENKRVLGYPSALSSPYTCNSGPPYGSRMLCFGGEDGFVSSGFPMKQTTGKGGGINDTSTPSTSSSSSNNSLSIQRSKGKEGRLGGSQKKPRRDQQPSSSANTNGSATKMRKEKLGERITALQQLVSPFGKSDAASVLHEALGYIKFLHDQVQVLSSPYLQQLPSPSNTQVGGTRVDLRSRGLCLVPISCTAHVAGSNGADLWASDHGE